MGSKILELRIPVEYSNEMLQNKISKIFGIQNFSFDIIMKSLDARNKRDIHWNIRLLIFSDYFKDDELEATKLFRKLEIPHRNRSQKAIVVGSGPAGFFAGYVLKLAGFDVSIIERGAEVGKRSKQISEFEKGGEFSPIGNYAYGEGGAGTFSDGKLTSRTKNINLEKKFVIDSYISAGAPEEIAFLSSPHIGTNNLIKVVKNLREKFENLGGKIYFETSFNSFNSLNGKVSSVETSRGKMDCDLLLVASGHSAYDTYRNLISSGAVFKTKSFAIGSRVEHLQEMINQAQWGRKSVKGLKAADYKLSFQNDDLFSVYSFCMCPGGKVVQASPRQELSVVNGMSYYSRNSIWANSAIVAGINLNDVLSKDVSALEALEWLEALEQKFYSIKNSFNLPANTIDNFISGKATRSFPESSYDFQLFDYDFKELFPKEIHKSISMALLNFKSKIKGFGEGVIMGLESKTSAPIQALRDENFKAAGFENLFIIGEGSGHSGGIISSAVDGIKAAMKILSR